MDDIKFKTPWIMENKIKQKRQLVMFCSLTVAYVSMFVGVLRFCLEIGKVVFTGAEVDLSIITLLVMYVCITISAVAIVRFLKNVDRGYIFDKKNIFPLRFFGYTVMLTGIILVILHSLSDSDSQTYMFYLLIGVFINIFSEVFAIGVKLKEEQDLTI